MGAFIRFIAGLALLPFVWAECRVAAAILPNAFTQEAPFISTPLLSMIAGFALWLLLACRASTSSWFYVLGHELTHACWALLTFSKVSKIKVSSNGGYCLISNPGMFTTLAPYFIPFYLLVVLAARALLGIWLDMSAYAPWWMGAVGFTYGFHVTNTIAALTKAEQSDIRVYGRFFSCVFIVVANLAFLDLGMSVAMGVPVGELWCAVAESATSVYAAVYAAFIGAAAKLLAALRG